MADILNFRGGINLTLNPWDDQMIEGQQCVSLQNLRHVDEFIESIPGTIKYHDESLGTDPITAVIPYYNNELDISRILCACGKGIYIRDDAQNNLRALTTSLTKNSIFSHTDRHNVTYISSIADGLKKYSGGNIIEGVGGGSTKPGNFRQILYMQEIDRLFAIRNRNMATEIAWSNISQPEIWDGASVDRIKSTQGDELEWAEILFGKLILLMTNSIWIYFVQGNEESWNLEKAPTSVGCYAFKTVKRVGAEIWFLGGSPNSQIGVYSFNGQTCKLLTEDISPLMDRINKDRIKEACADIKDDIYTLSFALDDSLVNNVSIDIDSNNVRENGLPAIYGLHTFGFYSSAILNKSYRNGEFLMGGENNGWLVRDGGTSFLSVAGTGGNLIPHRFLSAIYNEGAWDTWKRYKGINIYFKPRSFYNSILRTYVSHGTYADSYDARMQGHHMKGLGFDFDVLERPIIGSPDLAVHRLLMSKRMKGTSLQIELLNNNLDTRLAFEGFSFESSPLGKVRKAQSYAL